jgi:hypothetical protein
MSSAVHRWAVPDADEAVLHGCAAKGGSAPEANEGGGRRLMAVVAGTPPAVCIDDAYFPLVVLSRYAGLSVRTLRGYLTDRTRPLPHFRIGGKILIRRSDFDAWANQFKVSRSAVSVDTLVDDVVGGLR